MRSACREMDQAAARRSRDLEEGRARRGCCCASTPEEYGGAGGTFAHEAVLIDLLGKLGIDGWGLVLHNAIVAPYILHYGSEEQRKRWLPRLASGELVAAIAMTEPGTGSDLAVGEDDREARRQSLCDQRVEDVHHQRRHGELSSSSSPRPIRRRARRVRRSSVVETDEVQGFRRGRVLEKIGQKANDTAELFFDDVRVPTSNLIGMDEGHGLRSTHAAAAARAADHRAAGDGGDRAGAGDDDCLRQRTQGVRQAADRIPEHAVQARRVQDGSDGCEGVLQSPRWSCIWRRKLDPFMASMAKLWLTEVQCRVVDECLQLHGGYGYMNEYPIARMYADSRVQKIYGGTNEIMKLLIARTRCELAAAGDSAASAFAGLATRRIRRAPSSASNERRVRWRFPSRRSRWAATSIGAATIRFFHMGAAAGLADHRNGLWQTSMSRPAGCRAVSSCPTARSSDGTLCLGARAYVSQYVVRLVDECLRCGTARTWSALMYVPKHFAVDDLARSTI